MANSELRQTHIEVFASDGKIEALQKVFETGFTQLEIDTALENAIAHSQIKTAEYLLSLGADFSANEYQSAYFAVHNTELEGLRFAISKGVNINIDNGMLLNEAILTAIRSKNPEMVKWLLDNGAEPKLVTNVLLKLVEDCGSEELKRLVIQIPKSPKSKFNIPIKVLIILCTGIVLIGLLAGLWLIINLFIHGI